ncbi:hypothetical protein EDD21DRAFT_378199 [Dissophora ornata]|nr:hypothetical protein EDD21DRAFT_378199 [Dissophora ornata]
MLLTSACAAAAAAAVVGVDDEVLTAAVRVRVAGADPCSGEPCGRAPRPLSTSPRGSWWAPSLSSRGEHSRDRPCA